MPSKPCSASCVVMTFTLALTRLLRITELYKNKTLEVYTNMSYVILNVMYK